MEVKKWKMLCRTCADFYSLFIGLDIYLFWCVPRIRYKCMHWSFVYFLPFLLKNSIFERKTFSSESWALLCHRNYNTTIRIWRHDYFHWIMLCFILLYIRFEFLSISLLNTVFLLFAICTPCNRIWKRLC